MRQDEEHLRLLSIFHYILGGLSVLFSFAPGVYLVLGIFFLSAPEVFDEGFGPQPDVFIPPQMPPVPEPRELILSPMPPVPEPDFPIPDQEPISPELDQLIIGPGPPGPTPQQQKAIFAMAGTMMVIFGSIGVVFMLVLTILLICNGIFLARWKHYSFCFAVAVVSCLYLPFGTILGIFTIITLSRHSVKALFDEASLPEPVELERI